MEREKEIFRLQYGDEICLSEVPDLGKQFSALTLGEAIDFALCAISESGEFQSEDDADKTMILQSELERVKEGIKDLEERKQRVQDKIDALTPIDGDETRKLLEENDFFFQATKQLSSGTFRSASFRFYKDSGGSKNINCNVTFYEENIISR